MILRTREQSHYYKEVKWTILLQELRHGDMETVNTKVKWVKKSYIGYEAVRWERKLPINLYSSDLELRAATVFL